MIHGVNKASGYGVHYTAEGHKIEEETRQCCHCQYTWVYKHGSGIRRGYCTKHDGWVCGRKECEDNQKQLIKDYEYATSKVVSCLAFEEMQDYNANQMIKSPERMTTGFMMTPGGILVPV